MGSYCQTMFKNMLILLFFSITLAFDIYVENNHNSTLDTLDEEDRAFCCVTVNSRSLCSNACSGVSCSESCSVRCGVFNSVCTTLTCQEVASSTCSSTTTTTTTTTTTATTTTAAGISAGALCWDGTGVPGTCEAGTSCTPVTAGHCLAPAAPVSAG